MRLLWRGMLVALFGAVAIAWVGVLRFRSAASRVHAIPAIAARAEATPTTLERGRHLATTLGGCADCHAANFGGRVMEENAVVRLAPPNITPAGVVRGYSDSDWYRALLHGVNPRGKNLVMMPSKELRTFSDADILAIIAYIKSVPPVAAQPPPSRVSALGQIVLGLSGENLWAANVIDHAESRAGKTTPSGETVAHGDYLIGVCKGCHGADLRGGLRHGPPDAPLSANISPPAMAKWSRDQLQQLLRTGKRPDGTSVSDAMPWRAFSQVTDEELTAMWLALRR